MNLAKTIEELPEDRLCRDCADEDGYCPNRSLPCEISYSDIKRLVATLRKCETAIDGMCKLVGADAGSRLLSEIREVLDGKGN